MQEHRDGASTSQACARIDVAPSVPGSDAQDAAEIACTRRCGCSHFEMLAVCCERWRQLVQARLIKYRSRPDDQDAARSVIAVGKLE